MPRIAPEKRAIPGRLKKKRFPTTPENQVQNNKTSAAIKEPPTFLRSRGVAKCKMVINAIDESNQPKVLDKGISGWNGTCDPVTTQVQRPAVTIRGSKKRSHAVINNAPYKNTHDLPMRRAATKHG